MKESIYTPYPKAIFRETFNDEITLRKNSGVPTDISFANGKGEFNGTSSKANYNLGLNGTYSVRVRCNPIVLTASKQLLDVRGTNNDGTGTIIINTGTVCPSSGTVYVDSVLANTLTAGVNSEVVITGITLTQGTGANLSLIGSNFVDGNEFLGTIDLVEIYQGTLTASEVKNLYNDVWNKEQSFGGSAKSDVVVNGNFENWTADNPDNWIVFEHGDNKITQNGNAFRMVSDGTAVYLFQNCLIVGRKYKAIITTSDFISGGITFGSSTLVADAYGFITEVGTQEIEFIATTDKMYFIRKYGTTTDITVSEIKLIELNPKTLIDFDSTNGVLELGDLNETSTITDVTVNKNGAVWNGTTSLIDTGTDMISDKSVTIMGWIKAYSAGETDSGRIIDNGKTNFYVLSSGRLRIVSDGSTTATTPTVQYAFNKPQFVSVTRESDGTVNFYIGDKDNAPALSGSADLDSGTPEAGTTNVIIGNHSAANRTFDGLIPKLKVVEGILSLAEISRYWSSSLREVN